MIREIVTAAVMYWVDTVGAADTDIPPMRPQTQQQCRHKDPQKLRQCLDLKMQQQPDPYAALWDPNWVSSITPIPEVSITNTSAKTPDPNVAKKPLK
jgi:hypothetical protein